ncbi:MAG TPA: hypothetical protein VHB02_09600 [Acidimicrobiales bacterium]|nr:hypothetical protein [Acidimicrobiales bacterium]
MAGDLEKRGSGGLRVVDGLVLVAVGVVGVLIAFWALSFVAGILWGLVKIVILVAVVLGILWLLVGRRR